MRSNPLRRCLLVSQTVPATGGHGASIRVGFTLRALALSFDVSLLVVTQNDRSTSQQLPTELRDICTEVNFVHSAPRPTPRLSPSIQPQIYRSWNLPEVDTKLRSFQGSVFDLVFVYRLKMLPIWSRLRDRMGCTTRTLVLDLDDIESRTELRQTLSSRRVLGKIAFVDGILESARLRAAENSAGRVVDAMLVCSEDDRNALGRRIPLDVVKVVPNSAHFGEIMAPSEPGNLVRLLFVGSLDYEPNIQAIQWMMSSILPAIQSRLSVPVHLDIVGRRPSHSLVEFLSGLPGVNLHADVTSVIPYYERSDIVLAPIRSGGGTRIKIIEAFGHGRPVITTRTGAEGLDARDGEHLLYCETPQEFARGVASLVENPTLRASIVSAARTLAELRYSDSAFGARLMQAVSETTSGSD